MDNEDLIRDQIDETRASLTEKLETLEQKVAEKVEGATEAMETVTDKVQETVAAVTGGVEHTVEAVKDSMKESAQAVQRVFDISGHFDRHPWLMVGGSVAAGYFLGGLLAPRKDKMPVEALSEAGHKERRHKDHHHGNGHSRREERKPRTSSLLQAFAPEWEKLKGFAIGALMGTVREMVVQGLEKPYSEPLAEIIDSVTQKLGGAPLEESHEESRPEMQMGGSRLSGFPEHN